MTHSVNHFFITGLPRSRTAWLANFFTYAKSFCWHDASTRGGEIGIHTLVKNLERVKSEYCGDSDSALIFYAGELVRIFPEARWLLVHRPAAEARASFLEFFRARPHPRIAPDAAVAERIFSRCELELANLSNVLPRGRWIECAYEDLNSKLVLEEAWRFLTPGNPWSALRCELLQGLETNLMPEKVRA